MSEAFFAYQTLLAPIAEHDVRFLCEKDATYGGSWKRGGGRSAWFMLRRKIDRLMEMMKPRDPPYGWPTNVSVSALNMARLLEMTRSEDVFAQIQTRPLGDDGTVLAEIRDLRRYLLLVEAEMVARGCVTIGSNGAGSYSKSDANPPPGTTEDGGHHAAWSDDQGDD